MEMTRRAFNKLSGMALLALACGASVFTTGCGIMQDIANWGPIGLAAFNSVILVLMNAGINTGAAAVAVIRGAFQQVISDAKQYENINPPPAGAVASIRAAFAIIVTNFQSFLTSLNIPQGSLLTLIIGLAQVVLDTIAGFDGQLPQPAGSKKMVANMTFAVGPYSRAINPIKRTRRDFIKTWNGVCDANGYPTAKVPLSLLQHL